MLAATIVWAVIMVLMLTIVLFLYSDVLAMTGQKGQPLSERSRKAAYVGDVEDVCFWLLCVPTVLYGVVMTFLMLGSLTEADTRRRTRWKADTPRPTRQNRTAVSVERKAEAEQQSRRTRRELLLWLLLVALVYVIIVCAGLYFD